MRKALFGFVAVSLLIIGAAISGAAHAAQISGQISFLGEDTYNTNTGTIKFTNPGSFGAITGDYLTAFGLTPCDGCVTFSNFNYLSPTANEVIYKATLNNVTTKFNLTSITDYTVGSGADSLTVAGTGIVSLTGYDATNASFILTTQGGQKKLETFSATTDSSAVPEPASIALMLVGMLGLVGFNVYSRQV